MNNQPKSDLKFGLSFMIIICLIGALFFMFIKDSVYPPKQISKQEIISKVTCLSVGYSGRVTKVKAKSTKPPTYLVFLECSRLEYADNFDMYRDKCGVNTISKKVQVSIPKHLLRGKLEVGDIINHEPYSVESSIYSKDSILKFNYSTSPNY